MGVMAEGTLIGPSSNYIYYLYNIIALKAAEAINSSFLSIYVTEIRKQISD